LRSLRKCTVAQVPELQIQNRGNSSDNPARARTIYRCQLTSTRIQDFEIFAYIDSRIPDGIKTDRGRVYASVGGNCGCFLAVGFLIGRIKVKDGYTVQQ
jgi:hypothetical protein